MRTPRCTHPRHEVQGEILRQGPHRTVLVWHRCPECGARRLVRVNGEPTVGERWAVGTALSWARVV